MKFLSDILIKAGLVVEGSFSANAASNTMYAGAGTRLRTETNNLVFERLSSSGLMKIIIDQATLGATAKSYLGYSNATLNVILSNEHASGGLELRTSDVIRQQIFSNGNIVIGQASPVDAGYKFSVTGTAYISSSLTANAFVKIGGTSSQYLMADGTTSTLTNPITGTGVAGQVAYWSGTNTQTGSNNLFWDATNNNLGIGTPTPTVGYKLSLANGGIRISGTQATAGVTGAIDTQGLSLANSTNQILNYFVANGLGSTIVSKLVAAAFRVQTFPVRYTTSSAYGINVESAVKGAASDITVNYGIAVEDQTVGNTNYGIWSNVSSATDRWNLYMNGTAANWLNGNTKIGGTAGDAGFKLDVDGTMRVTGASTFSSSITANSFIKAGGLSTEILRADGSLLTMPIVLTSPANGEVLKYNGTNWVNSSDAGVTGSGAAGQVTFWGSSSTVTGSNDLFWNSTNGYLGIGTNTPSERLHVVTSAVSTAIFSHTGANGAIDVRNTGTLAANRTSQVRLSNGTTFFGANDRTWQIINLGTSATASVYTLQYFDGTNYTRPFTITDTGRLLLGSTSDNGLRFQVTGDASIRGTGTTSASNALLLQDSAGVNIYTFRNDGQLIGTIRNAQTEASINFSQVTANNNAGTNIPLIWYQNTSASQRAVMNGVWEGTNRAGFNFTHGQGSNGVSMLFNNPSNQTIGGSTFTINETFNPTSGTAFRIFTNISPTINQTGGANGITYGIRVAPTLTAAADWRSIEWANNTGWGLYGLGTAANYLAGNLSIGTTTTTNRLEVWGSGNTAARIVGQSAGNATLILSSGGVTAYSIKSGNGDSSLRIDQDGTDRLILASGGNLGLGVVPSAWAPSRSKIEFASNTTIAGFVGCFGGSSANNQMGFGANAYFNASSQWINNTGGGSGLYTIQNNLHKWYVAGIGSIGSVITWSEPMTLFATGNLAVGTTTDAGFRLDVNGTMRVSGASTFSSSITSATDISARNGDISIGVDSQFSAPYMALGFGGRTNAFNRIYAARDTTAGIVFSATTGAGFEFRTNGHATRAIIVESDGTFNLQRSASGANTTLQFRNEVSVKRAKIVFGGTNEELGFYAGSGATEHLSIASTGAATFSSTVTGASFIPTSSTIPTNGMYLSTTNTLAFATNSTEDMRLTSDGNLHIGTFTSNTGERLQVNGSIKATNATLNALYLNGTSPQIILNNQDYLEIFDANGTTGSVRIFPESGTMRINQAIKTSAPSTGNAGSISFGQFESGSYQITNGCFRVNIDGTDYRLAIVNPI